MPAVNNIPGTDNEVLQEALSAYADEAYTTARKLSGTGIVGSNDKIDPSTETYVGQVRWDKPLNPTINIASLTDSADGTSTTTGTDFLRYVKTVRTHGAENVNMKQVVTQRDGLAKIGRDFANTKAQDEHNAILAVIKSVALSEALNGTAEGSGVVGLGGQTFSNDPENKQYGFYVDVGANKMVADPTSAIQGAQRADAFLQAMAMAWKDYEPEYAYLIASPEIMASLRSANLVDSDRVVEGNTQFTTILQGKFRLIQTRATQSFSAPYLAKLNTGAGVDIVGTKTSFIILPGAIAMEPLQVPMPVEFYRNAKAFKGGGTSSVWYRWGYVLVPAGYDWVGSDQEFPSDAQYGYAVEGGTPLEFSTVVSGTLAATTGTFVRKSSSALSLGILPVFHS